MEEFNNIELKDEELDQVAGGVRTATFELLEDGRITFTTHFREGGVSEDSKMTIGKGKSIEPLVEKYRKWGYEIIFKGFEGR